MAGLLYPLFLDLHGRKVVVVGAGPVGAQKALSLCEAGASVLVVAPLAVAEIAEAAAAGRLRWEARAFVPEDLSGAWLAVAATGDGQVNARVASAAAERHLFVNAVDDKRSASAYAAALLRRGPITVAISSGGRAPALCRLLREALEALLPDDATATSWVSRAEDLRKDWREQGVPMSDRFSLLVKKMAGGAS